MDDLSDLQSQIVRAVSGHAEYQFARWDSDSFSDSKVIYWVGGRYLTEAHAVRNGPM